MAVPIWQPGTLYQPGDIVRPVSSSGVTDNAIANAGFESGDTAWTKGTGWTIEEDTPVFEGSWHAIFSAVAGTINSNLISDSKITASPGQTCSFDCYLRSTADEDDTFAQLHIRFFDSDDNVLSTVAGDFFRADKPDNAWVKKSASAVAPANTSYFKALVGASIQADSDPCDIIVDAFILTSHHEAATTGLVFTAVQSEAGFSGSSEPAWPDEAEEQVVDNDVTWEALTGDRITWEAHPILVSGSVEPTFPTEGSVPDNTISWTLADRRIEDENTPHSKVVALAASKIFATDKDIVPFCATVNPLDWTTRDDAGYLPFGLQTYGDKDALALGLYRGNLVVFNESGFQMWQVDEDPQDMALLDAAPVGSRYHRALQPVMNDLVFLNDQGIRSIGIAGASTNLQAGDFGKAIDPLVQPALAAVTDTAEALGLYIAGLGQYWLIIGDEAFVLTINGNDSKSRSWSRYTFPSDIDDWTVLDGELYLRSGDLVWRFSEDATLDDEDEDGGEGGADVAIEGSVWWPYLDFGQIGVTKTMEGFDLVLTGTCSVQFGYDQTDTDLVTAGFEVTEDTLVGQIIPMPLAAPSIQMRLTFSGGAWDWSAAVIYLSDMALGT